MALRDLTRNPEARAADEGRVITLSGVLRALGALAGELLAPSTCVACDARVGPRTLFCAACAVSVERWDGDAPCFAPFLYGGAVASAITRMKYGGRPEIAPRLGELLASRLSGTRHAADVDLVVPVPIHPRRLVARGFDQASLVARPVALALARPRVVGLLERVQDTQAQVGLSQTARRVNVADAFRCRAPHRVRGRGVLLVDDVVTTGATIASCAAVLARAGARRVHAAAIAVRTDSEE